MTANQLEEAAAADNRLPVEALAHDETNRQLLETEAEIERLRVQRGGNARGREALSWAIAPIPILKSTNPLSSHFPSQLWDSASLSERFSWT